VARYMNNQLIFCYLKQKKIKIDPLQCHCFIYWRGVSLTWCVV